MLERLVHALAADWTNRLLADDPADRLYQRSCGAGCQYSIRVERALGGSGPRRGVGAVGGFRQQRPGPRHCYTSFADRGCDYVPGQHGQRQLAAVHRLGYPRRGQQSDRYAIDDLRRRRQCGFKPGFSGSNNNDFILSFNGVAITNDGFTFRNDGSAPERNEPAGNRWNKYRSWPAMYSSSARTIPARAPKDRSTSFSRINWPASACR